MEKKEISVRVCNIPVQLFNENNNNNNINTKIE